MKLSIVIVNYNGAHFLTACLDSVLASKTPFPFEVIVVDNQSTDGSRAILDGYQHRLIRLNMGYNSGFSAGNNAGARLATGDYLLLLNNDTVVFESTLTDLVTYFDEHPDIGMLAPKLLNGDGSLQTPGSLLMRWAYYGDRPRSVSFLAGAAIMLQRSFYETLGGLDEAYFFYNEDLDLCKTIQKQGRSLVYFPQASMIHFGGLSTRTRRRGSILEGYRGGLYFCKKHYGGGVYAIYRWVVLLDLLPRWAMNWLLSLFQSDRAEMARGYGDVIKLVWFNLPLVRSS